MSLLRPGVNVNSRDNAPPSSIPTDIGTGFEIGVTESGSLLPDPFDLVQNLDEYVVRYNPSGLAYVPGQTMYNSTEEFFNEGGNRLFIGRVVGAAAVVATVAVGTAWQATAASPGLWGNALRVIVNTPTEDPNIAAGRVRVKFVKASDVNYVYEESYDLASVLEGISWSAQSNYVKLAAGSPGTAIPTATLNVQLASGADDTAGITNAQWQSAADSLSATLGPGIVFAPGATTDALHVIMANHALARGRGYFADGPNSSNTTTLINSSKQNIDSSGLRSRFSGLFVPWLIVPATGGVTKTIPPSAGVAGLFCRNVGGGLTANDPAAGDNGRLRMALDLTQNWTDAQRQLLNENGVNVIKDVYGVRKVYGWRTTADPVNDKRWINLGNSLLHRQIVALAGAVGEGFVFRQIDGQGTLIGEFIGSLIGEVCLPLYSAGSLYGATPEEAFKVDGGPSVNTLATLADNQLRAVISVRMSPFSEMVNIEVVKYLVTEAIPA